MMDSWKNVVSCSRRCLFVVMVTGIIGLVFQNDLLNDVYRVYLNREISTTYETDDTGVALRNNVVHRALQTYNTNALTFPPHFDLGPKPDSLFKTQETIAKPKPSVPTEMRLSWNEKDRRVLNIFILSAIGSNVSSVSGHAGEVKLHGWQALKHKYTRIKCCIMWISNGNISEFYNPERTSQQKRLSLLGTQISCAIKESLWNVFGVTLQFAQRTCPFNKSEYIKPLIPLRQPNNDSFAICLKILYGNVTSKSLIEWLEYYREMKVDKVFMFVYDIPASVRQTVKHYTDMGFVESRPFNFPWKGGRTAGMKTPLAWEDEQVAIYDCFQRHQGYTYMSILDLDEFLLPRKHENIKQLMSHLSESFPKAGGFALKSYLFNKNWAPSGPELGSDLTRYIYRTHVFGGIPARTKNILRTSRVIVDKFFHTHTFTPEEGFESITVDETTAAINHYRPCYRDLRRACARFRAVLDKDILKVYARFKNRTTWPGES